MSSQVTKQVPRRDGTKNLTRVYADPQAFPPSILEDTSIVRPHRGDKIYTFARTAITQHNRKSLKNFTDPLRIEAISSKATTYGPTESNQSTMAIQYRDSSYLVPFKLLRSNDGPFELMCDVKGGWQKFEDWLARLEAPPGRIGRGDKAYQAQFNWWSKNGMSFRFWDLPAELRTDHFYKAYTPDEVSMQRWHPFNGWLWSRANLVRERHVIHVDHGEGVDPARKIIRKAQSALLMTCRQVNAEVIDYIWKQCTKYFQYHYLFKTFVQHELSSPTVFNALRCIELDFSHKEYINFFRVPLQPFRDLKDFGCQGAADDLQGLTEVRELTLVFQSPMSAKLDDPWGYTGDHRGHPSYYDWSGRRDREGFATSCQKTMVDWILTAAHPYIKHIPKVNLEGAIKHSTKLNWDMILKEEQDGKLHDLGAALHAIGNMPDDALPPPCYCSTPCAYEGYSDAAHLYGCRLPRCWCHRYKGLANSIKKQIKQYKFDFED